MTGAFKPYFVVPMKCPLLSKTRLRRDMPRRFCNRLATELFRRTVLTIREGFPDTALLVVTASSDIARIASATGAVILPEKQPIGLNHAATSATLWGEEHGFSHQILVHADIPLIDQKGLMTVLDKIVSQDAGVTICGSWSGGTSVLATRIPSPLPFLFGPDSLSRHLKAARQLGLTVARTDLPNMEMDLDNLEDFEALVGNASFDRFLLESIAR